jgi:hypothetical protein
MEEKWVDISGYEGLYKVSNTLKVFSLISNKILNQYTLVRHGLPYKFVCLSKEGRQRTAYIHRLVAIAFIPNPLNKREVDHIDGDSLNNDISNLRWCSSKENARNPITVYRKRMNSGRNKKKPVVEVSKDGYVIRSFNSLREAERETGLWCSEIKNSCEHEYMPVKGRFFDMLEIS